MKQKIRIVSLSILIPILVGAWWVYKYRSDFIITYLFFVVGIPGATVIYTLIAGEG